MRILKIEPEKAPFVKEIESGLRALQDEVQGSIEAVCLEPGVILCCNEEGKYNILLYYHVSVFCQRLLHTIMEALLCVRRKKAKR